MGVRFVLQIESTFFETVHTVIVWLDDFHVFLIVSGGIDYGTHATPFAAVVKMSQQKRNFGQLGDSIEAPFPLVHPLAGTLGRDKESNLIAVLDEVGKPLSSSRKRFSRPSP